MPKPEKKLHLFMTVGDDEIQVDSYDRKTNKQIQKLKEKEQAAVIMLDDDDAPAFLRAAVKMTNVTIAFHKTAEKKEITEAQRQARSENGKKTITNLNNQSKE